MSGHIRKRGKTWSFKIEGHRDPVTNKRRQIEKGGFRTKADAERAQVSALAKMNLGEFVRPTKTTVAQLMLTWLDSHCLTVEPTTEAKYRSLATNHIVPRFGGANIQQVRPADVEAFYRALLSGDDKYKPLSDSTISNIQSMLFSCFKQAVRDDKMTRNPCADIKMPKSRTKKPGIKAWTAADAQEFLRASQSDPRHSLWQFLLNTGLRRGEVLALRWEDVDLNAQHVTIRQQLVAVSHVGEIRDVKTRMSRRTIDINKATVKSLQAHRRDQLSQRMQIGQAWKDLDLVFCRADGSPYIPRSLGPMFIRAVKKTELKRISVHDLRHTHATILMLAGVSPKVVQERLGHADVATTLRIYSHVLPGMQSDAAEKFSIALGN